MRRRREDTEAAVARVARITPSRPEGWTPVVPGVGTHDGESHAYAVEPSGFPGPPVAGPPDDPVPPRTAPAADPREPPGSPRPPDGGYLDDEQAVDRRVTGRPEGESPPEGRGRADSGPAAPGASGARPPWDDPPGVGDALRAAVEARIPPALRSARLGSTSRTWRALALVLAVAVAVGGATWWRSRAVPAGAAAAVTSSAAVSSSAASSSAISSGAASGGTAPSAGLIVVDVTGRVRRPGVVRLPDGSRVTDAIRAAGGLRHGAHTRGLNLARKLTDGEQIVVGAPGGVPTGSPETVATGGAGGTGDDTGAPIDLNAATLDQLDTLPGVGPVLAQNILDYRTRNGPFRSVDQLQDVTGIGDARYAQIAPRVRV